MPRDSSGVYRLPAGNPVVPDTIIESVWANTTLDDVATALTGSLPRSGVAPMLGPLTLSADPITQSRQAVSKEYVDQFLAAATGMPLGAITAYATNGVPAGWLLCNGQAVNRTTYAGLFATLGTIYGSGDGVNTFNVPDLRNEFIRGLGGSSVLGTHYAASLAAHNHGVGIVSGSVSADHTHAVNIVTGTESVDHSHPVSDPGHFHTTLKGAAAGGGGAFTFQVGADASLQQLQTDSKATGITVGNQTALHTHNVIGATGNMSANHSHNVSGNTFDTGGTETAPQHMVMNYIIKAVEDATTSGNVVVGITSSDTQLITINSTNPASPVITPVFNVPGGMTKLDANGLVPISQIPNLTSNNLGFFDASSGALPSGTFDSGDTYTISVQGTLDVYNPATLTSAPTVVAVGTGIQYVTGSPTNPTGWYSITLTTTYVNAVNVTYVPPGIGAVSTTAAAHLPGATLAEVASARNVICWGDSLTAGIGDNDPFYPQELGLTSKYTTENQGVIGDTSTQIRARFTPANPNDAIQIIWAGRNNYIDSATVLADVAAMVAMIPHERYLVLTVINGEFPEEYSGQPNYDAIVALNNSLIATYGAHALDIRSLMVAAYNPSIPQDVTDHGHDTTPSSLRSDAIHLNAAGAAFVSFEVEKKLATFNFASKLLTTENFPDITQKLAGSSLQINGKEVILASGEYYNPTGAVYAAEWRVDTTDGVKYIAGSGPVLTTNSHWCPALGNSYDLGFGSEVAWRNGYFAGAVVAGNFQIGGKFVVREQQPAIANATDAATAISQLNALLGALRYHGLIAT